MDLTTTYLGLELRNPLVASASPLSNTIAGIRQLADSGVGAIVLYSLFEEQLRREAEQHAVWRRPATESFAEALSYFPSAIDTDGDGGLRRYVSLIERAVAAVDVPVIASLNGTTPGGWTDFATALEQGRRGGDRTERLPPAGQSAAARPRRGAAVHRDADDCEGRGQRAGGGQASPVLQLHGRDGASASMRPVPTAWCCSTGSCNQTSIPRP